jgi:hypothetical protein
MNADTGEMYRDEQIEAAEERGEALIYGKLETLEAVQPLIQGNRAYRRQMQRLQTRQERKMNR